MEIAKMITCLVVAILVQLHNSTGNGSLPMVLTTWKFSSATAEAWRVLNQANSTAIDALVAGCSQCETEQCDGTVGFGGSPDENAETTLDALIIDGSNMNMGAVANIRQIKEAIMVARHVLENTKHSMLAGDQATDFAVQMGFQKQSLSTSKSKNLWKTWRTSNCQPNFWQTNVTPNPEISCGPYRPISGTKNDLPSDRNARNNFEFGRWNHDTIGMIVIDQNRNIVAGTSTNGAKHKIPGRVGDSPIPGAGAYAVSDFGGAAATGDGDVMMRFLPSFAAVENLRNNLSPKAAAADAIGRILRYYPSFVGGLIVAKNDGSYSAACAGMDFFPFSVVKGDNSQTVRIESVKCIKSPIVLNSITNTDCLNI